MINITEIERKKKYLRSYGELCNSIRKLQLQKEELQETIRSVQSQKYDGMPRSNKITDISDKIVQLDEVIEDIIEMQAQLIAKKCLIHKSISNMKNGREGEVLLRRYIMQDSWEIISKAMSYDRSYLINKIHNDALIHFEIGDLNAKK